MMNANDLAKMFEMSYGAIKRNLEDVTQEESLKLPPAGNSLNWVLGHVVVYRGSMLKLVGRPPVFEGEHTNQYRRGSHPDGTEKYLDLATLRGMLSDAHEQLIPALAILTEKQLSASVSAEPNRPPATGSIGDALARLSFHESYHAGQIGLLRRIAGKAGAIS